ncbi:membrane protein [Mycolicibacterium celeriflavum]|uniref:Membrane protein n=1 Tax=Mycolicibacterium celeriflavum TaxID=1249101 RepID=A0A7I7RK65_MYCCF|nr:membrane protein [Mycolicibacterium celeriflavum]
MRAQSLVAPAYALVLVLAVTAPLLAPGYLLLRDAVSTPRSYLSDAALGLSEAAPRALPQDFFVAVASSVVDGAVVVKSLLIAGLWLAGWGAARLAAAVVPESGVAGQCVATTIAVWNPYVAERLLQGHWSLLVGYGCLPWVAAAMLGMRARPSWSAGAGLVFWIALAGLTPTGLMLAATVALVCVFAPGDGWSRWRCAGLGLAVAVVAALPWLVAATVAQSLESSQAEGVAAFAARAEPGLGTLVTLAGLGGIWNGEAVPASRTTLFAVVGTAVLLGVVALGLPVVLRRPASVPLLALAAVAVVVPALMATGPGLAVVEAAIRALPGLGVVRDAQKWVALAVPGYALAGAAAVLTARRWSPGAVAALVCCAALIATLPDMAWGVGGKVAPVQYPPGWAKVAAMINTDPRPVAVLPVGSMRLFDWAGDAPVLDPLPRWVRAEVLSTGDLEIGGQIIHGEGQRAREVQEILVEGADRDALADAGVGWVVVESSGVESGFPTTHLPLPVAYTDDDLTLYRVGGSSPPADGRGVVLAAHIAWLALLLVGGGVALVTAVRGRQGR